MPSESYLIRIDTLDIREHIKSKTQTVYYFENSNVSIVNHVHIDCHVALE